MHTFFQGTVGLILDVFKIANFLKSMCKNEKFKARQSVFERRLALWRTVRRKALVVGKNVQEGSLFTQLRLQVTTTRFSLTGRRLLVSKCDMPSEQVHPFKRLNKVSKRAIGSSCRPH